METTIQVNKKDALWWHSCCKKRNVPSKDLFSEFRKDVGKYKDRKFYDSLPKPSNYRKPLEGKKIGKNYKEIRFS